MSATTAVIPVEDGQFDDAPEETPVTTAEVAAADARAGHTYIDDENILEWSSGSSEEDEEQDEFDAEEDEMEAAAFENLRAEDEDWEITERGASHLLYQCWSETKVSNQTLRNSIIAFGSTSLFALAPPRAQLPTSMAHQPWHPYPPSTVLALRCKQPLRPQPPAQKTRPRANFKRFRNIRRD